MSKQNLELRIGILEDKLFLEEHLHADYESLYKKLENEAVKHGANSVYDAEKAKVALIQVSSESKMKSITKRLQLLNEILEYKGGKYER